MARSPAELFDRFHLAIYRYLLRMTGRADVAEDLTQDVFVRLLRSGTAPESPESERGWLFSVARNLLIDWQRRSTRNPVQNIAMDGEQATVDARHALSFDVHEALRRLPEADREAFLLRVTGGFGHEEIAAITASTPASVRSRIFRARSALRSALARNVSGPSTDKPTTNTGSHTVRQLKVVP